jgi:hypothetical protein
MPDAEARAIPSAFLPKLPRANLDSAPIFPSRSVNDLPVPPDLNVGMKVDPTLHTVSPSSYNFIADAYASLAGVDLYATMM